MKHTIIPQKPEEAFSFICHFIFAIVIANSYDLAAKVFLSPPDPVYSSLDLFLTALELSVGYVAIIAGWLGYARSVSKWPHQDTKYGMLRFVTDIAVLFCYFGLIEAADPTHDVFRDQFTGWICALFLLYFVSDVFKRQDHKSKTYNTNNNRRLKVSMVLTLIFLGVSVVLYVLNAHARGLWDSDNGALYLMILVGTIFMLLLYRVPKWNVDKTRTRDKPSRKRPRSKPPDGANQISM